MTEKFERLSDEMKLRAALLDEEGEWTPDCLEPDDFIGLCDRGAEYPDADRLLTHMTTCAHCRREFGETRLMLRLADEVHRLEAQQSFAAPQPAPTLSFQTELKARRPQFFYPTALAASLAVAALLAGGIWTDRERSRQQAASIERTSRQIAAVQERAAALAEQNHQLQGRTAQVQREAAAERKRVAQAETKAAHLQSEVAELQRRHTVNSSALSPLVSPNSASLSHQVLSDGAGVVVADASGELHRTINLPPNVVSAWNSQRLETSSVLKTLGGSSAHLMGGPGTSTDFSLKAPVGVVVETDQPDFKWRPLPAATAYQVTVADDRQNVVAQSGSITKMEWRPDKPLPRNQVYQWQVVALKDGQELAKAPDAGGASAKFQIISRETHERLERARQLYPDSPLTLGVLYAQAGFLEDAEAQFQALVKANPRSPEARRLLADVQKLANVQKLHSAP